jgi:hypothetical protein
MKNETEADRDELLEAAGRLDEIRAEIKDLMSEALDLVRGTGEEARARAYWYAHVMGALDEDEYRGSMSTMAEAQEALEAEANGEDDDE